MTSIFFPPKTNPVFAGGHSERRGGLSLRCRGLDPFGDRKKRVQKEALLDCQGWLVGR